jgi:TRAP-type C4-dicarboxylate transport system permease small subunit
MIKKILDKGETISQAGAWVSGCILFGISILITIEVILRKLFSISMGGADEISGYAMAASCSWGFAYALFRKAHIRIDVLYNKFSQSFKNTLDIASLSLFGIYMSILSYYAFQVFLTSLNRHSTANTPLHTPLWIPQLIWASGLILFTLSIYLILAGTIVHLLRKDAIAAQRLSGATTLEEEIEDGIVGTETAKTAFAGGLR